MFMKKFYLMTLALIIMGAATASAQKTAVKPAKEAQQVGWVNLITNDPLRPRRDTRILFRTK